MIRKGLTLVELLVVIALVGIIVGILLPAVQSVRSAARRTECMNNLRQVTVAVLNFQSANRRFPVGIYADDDPQFPSMTWLVQVLPFIEHDKIWQNARHAYQIGSSPFDHVGLRTPVSTYSCPATPGADQPQWTHENKVVALTCYLGVNGTNYKTKDGIFYVESDTRPADVTDGLSNTLLIGERPPSNDYWYGWWYAGFGQAASGSPDMLLGIREVNDGANYAETCPPGPYQFAPGRLDEHCDLFHFWSVHFAGANFALADGSVRLFAYDANALLPVLATRAGAEIAILP